MWIAGCIYAVFYQPAGPSSRNWNYKGLMTFSTLSSLSKWKGPLWHWPRSNHMPPITEQLRHFSHAPEKVFLLKCLRARVSGQLNFLVIWRTTSQTFAFLTFWKYFLISAYIFLLWCTAESAWGLCVCESSSCSQLGRYILLSKTNWCRHRRRRGTGRSHHWPLVPKSEADFSSRSQYQLFF